MSNLKITILGIGNVLFSDEGFGIRIIELLKNKYKFPNNVLLVDGGVLGINLMGIIAQADKLFIIDSVKNNGKPGDIYKIYGESIPERIRFKNSLHQIDFLESLTICKTLNNKTEAMIIGIEPKDIITLKPQLSKIILEKANDVVKLLLDELKLLKIKYEYKNKEYKILSSWKTEVQ